MLPKGKEGCGSSVQQHSAASDWHPHTHSRVHFLPLSDPLYAAERVSFPGLRAQSWSALSPKSIDYAVSSSCHYWCAVLLCYSYRVYISLVLVLELQALRSFSCVCRTLTIVVNTFIAWLSNSHVQLMFWFISQSCFISTFSQTYIIVNKWLHRPLIWVLIWLFSVVLVSLACKYLAG